LKSAQPDHVLSLQTPLSKTLIDWSVAHRIVLVRLRSIGDTVLLTPCLAAIKDANPATEITVVSEPLSAPVIDNHPLVDRLVVAGSSLQSRLKLIGRLRREKFDVAFNMHGGPTGTLLTAMSGARFTVGYEGFRQSWMLKERAPAPDVILGHQTVHSVEQQLALLAWAGLPYPERPRLTLAIAPEAEASIRARLSELGMVNFVVIAAAAAFESKQWPAAGFAAVADHLKKRLGLSCLLIAGPGQEAVAQEVSEASQSKPPRLTGLSLKELIALMSLSKLYIGNDSGPMHIAAAVGRPLVVVFGSSNPTVWHPWTDAPYRVVEAGSEIQRVTVEEMIAAVEEVVQAAPAAKKRAL
jgi:ADP-heptose:LPS heptosyltransferase